MNFSLRKFVRTRPNFFMHKRRVQMEENMKKPHSFTPTPSVAE